MLYSRIESALNTCRSHVGRLDPTDIKDKELETYLVGGLVVLIVSEYEDYLESVFVRRAEKCGDPCATNYIKRTLAQKFRSPDLSKITNTLQLFDTAYNDEFKNEITNSPEHAAWDSLMKARHAVVHKKGALNLTFRELLENYDKTKKVIKKVESTLGVHTIIECQAHE
ncbi:HEPN domain-containing protein [Shewanella algae]|uniref:HEPN domain-containing protein n=1 Tax=Shewanella algae TaxID=38313 RepID=UPI00313C5E64